MNKLVEFFFIFLLAVSCSTHKKNESRFTETVNFENTNHQIELDPSNNKNDTYGPNIDENSSLKRDDTQLRKPVVTLDLVPSLYASLSYITLFRELEKNKIYPNIINTSGFSLVIAALYSKYKSASKLEWKVFALLRKLKGIKVHTSNWYDVIDNFLMEEFKNTRLEQLKILVSVPTSGLRNELITSGKITEIIMNSIKIANSNSFINRPHYDYFPKLKKLGTDLYYLVSGFPNRFNFKTPNGFAWGIYTRVSGLYRSQGEALFEIKNEFPFIDTLPNLSDMLINTKSDVTFISDKISQEVADWINKNN